MPNDDFSITLSADTSAGIPTKGIHLAKCISAKREENKNKDGYNLVLEFEILSKGQEGRKVRLWQTLKDSVAWRYTAVLKSFGIVPGPGGKLQFGRNDLVGKNVRLSINHEDLQGRTVARVEDVLVPEGETKHEQEPVPEVKATPAPGVKGKVQPKAATVAKKDAPKAKPEPEPEDDEEADEDADSEDEEQEEENPVDGNAADDKPEEDLPF